MVGPNKILTVSYGTFSCTLEGFDDPFSTMRGIAEYFRDLAADDRYFGAEPPTPDAEMLHRIAEKEIQRRVEARVSATGIVLTQMDDEDASASKKKPSTDVADDQDGEDAIETEAAVGGIATDEATTVEDPFVKMVEPAATVATQATHETVAERLARIRAVVQQGSTDYAEDGENAEPLDLSTESDADDQQWFASDDQEDDTLAVELDGEDAASEDEADLVLAMEETEPHDEAGIAEAFELAEEAEDLEDSAEDLSFEEDTTAAEAESYDAEDEGDTLDIAALAAGLDEETDEAALEDEDEDDTAPDIDLGGILGTEDVVLEDEDQPADDVMAAFEDAQDADENEIVTLANEPSSFADLIEAEKQAEGLEEADEEGADEETVSRLLKMRLGDFARSTEAHDAFVSTQEPEEAFDTIEAEAVAETTEDDEPTAPEPFVLEHAVEEQRLVLDEAHQVDQTEDDTQQETFEEMVEDAGDDVAAVAEPESEVAEETAESTDDEVRPAPVKGEATSLSRLLRVTNNEMEEKETSRRRSAIAHLKAAVAATRADREHAATDADGTEAKSGDNTEAYREDLARVVRPRRPEEGVRQTPRRMPPLMLVSEQRVDHGTAEDGSEEAPAADIRPKRINRDAMDDADDGENIFSAQGSFEEFAREMGAVELTDLLEAAAAYYHYVEGQPHFSRPQIMKAVEDMGDAADFSREERLRSFGMLLRRGKIRKIRRGQFEIADSTRFRPELRAGE